MTVFTPRSQQSKEKTAKIYDYLSFLTMRLDRVAQVLSPTPSLCRARSLVCYSAAAHAELNAMFHSDQKSIENTTFFNAFFCGFIFVLWWMRYQAPLCKGSSATGGEGLSLYPLFCSFYGQSRGLCLIIS